MRYFIVNMFGGYELLVQSETGHIELECVEEVREIDQKRFEQLLSETDAIEL